MEILCEWVEGLLHNVGVAPENMRWTAFVVYAVILTFVAVVSFIIVHKIVVSGISRIVAKTAVKWDDDLFNDKLLSCVCHLVPPVLLLLLIPWILYDYPYITYIAEKGLMIYIVIVSVRLFNVFLSSAYLASQHNESLKSHPLKGMLQMLKIVAICVGVIIIISLLIDKNPLIILSGLGASAAILMLVFKDTIMGLVAGVQLSANDMLKPGDWIMAPKHGVNGVVEDVTLTTVKVRNWDMTIVTIPPYSLVSESFQNWRGMQASGGRRVMRSVNFDVNSIRFLSDEELAQYSALEWYQSYSSPSKRVVNLHIFRHYIEWYLTNHQMVNEKMLLMVRQLQPTNHGVPVELYFFATKTSWKEYEYIQSEIFDHVFAVAHDFHLKIFQSPAGLDFTGTPAN